MTALVFIALAVAQPNFRSADNLWLLAKQSAQLAVVSAGMTLVIATGGIDISVGSLVALCSMTLGLLCVRLHWNWVAASAAAVATGGLCGLFNGTLIARAKLPPIIVTLATLAAARAGAALFNDGGSISGLPRALSETFDRTIVLGLPLLLWIGLSALFLCGVVLRRTTFGRDLLALGGNRVAAQLSGRRIVRIETMVYALNGALAGFVAVLNTAYKSTATPDAGLNLELTAIAAVVLGGTVITGGKATLLGTALGVLTIQAIISGARLFGQEDRVAWFLVGLALLLAVEAQKRRAPKTV